MMKRKMITSLLALTLMTTLTITAGGFGKNENKKPQLLKGSDNKEYQYVSVQHKKMVVIMKLEKDLSHF